MINKLLREAPNSLVYKYYYVNRESLNKLLGLDKDVVVENIRFCDETGEVEIVTYRVFRTEKVKVEDVKDKVMLNEYCL